MKPERWKQIDQLFHSMLEWPPADRAFFLNQACPDDQDLRREVESLVLAHERNGDFLNTPAYEVSTEVFADCLAGLLAGQQIGHYKILSLLGIATTVYLTLSLTQPLHALHATFAGVATGK